MQPGILVITKKCREWQYWKEWSSEPLSHTPCRKKTESVIMIIKGKAKIRRVQRNIPKRV